MPLPDDARFQFLDYAYVKAVPGIEWLVCRDESCEKVFHITEVKASGFRCSIHKRPLEQLAHLFIHGACGEVRGIVPDDGPLKCRNASCGEPLRLHLNPANMIRSYWWCQKCKSKGLPPEGKGKDIPGYRQQVRRNCPTCREQWKAAQLLERFDLLEGDQELDLENDSGGWKRMVLMPARTVFVPRTLATVDIPAASDQNLLDSWFGNEMDDQAIRDTLSKEPQVQKMFDENPTFREAYLSAKRKEQDSKAQTQKINPPNDIREDLRDYAGALLAHPRPLESVTGQEQTVQYLLQECGVSVKMLLDGLDIVSATYGYLIGSSDPAKARLNIFTMYGNSYGILAQRVEAEALMFELDPQRVWRWLIGRRLATPDMIRGGETIEQCLRRNLVSASDPVADAILNAVTVMMHSISHLLIRTSERYTGISRDNLQELIWPRALAFVLYDGSGIDLGMLNTTFEGLMYDWFYGARYDASHCPHDPICYSDPQMAACHACLYIAERNCNVYWNRNLDRRYLIGFLEKDDGYWTRGM